MEESSCQYQPYKKVKVKVAQSCLTLWDPVDCSPPGSSVPGILLTQGLNLGLLHCRQILYRLSHEGSPPALWEALYIRYRVDSSHDMHRGHWWLSGKESACSAANAGSIPGSGRSPGGGIATTPVFLPGESYGQRSLVGYSPQGQKELDRTEQLHHRCHTCEQVLRAVPAENW